MWDPRAHVLPTVVLMAKTRLWCKYCNRSDFASQSGLNYHLNHGKCQDAYTKDLLGSPTRTHGPSLEQPDVDDEGAEEFIVPEPPHKETGPSFLEDHEVMQVDLDFLRQNIGGDFDSDSDPDSEVTDNDDPFRWDVLPKDDDSSSSEEESIDSDLMSSNSDLNPPEVLKVGPVEDDEKGEGPLLYIRDQFIEYVNGMVNNHVPLSADEKRSVRLMAALRKKQVALNGYPEIMEWHLKDSGLLREHEKLSSSSHYIGRETMLERLKQRYNFSNKYPFERKVKLPTSGTVVKITCHDARCVIQQLLTDPRIQDSDYLFFDDDPRAPPPEIQTKLIDFNTGDAFRDTYKILIDPTKGEQLLGLPLYIDGASISNFHDLELIQVKIALGIMNRVTRMKEWVWGSLGSIEKVHEQGGRGRKILKESNHMEVQDASDSDDHSSDADSVFGIGQENVEDLHAMISVILESMEPIQRRGFMWDQAYRGVIYRNILYKIFVPFVKCDNVEAEKLCGKYQIRCGNVKHVCRSCHIPMREANDHLHKVRHKTAPEIQKLVHRADLEGLRSISQTYLINAFHKVRFSLGSLRGIHGACPTDMLHTIQLGLFKYLRDIFFRDLGATSSISKDINGLAKVFCRLLGRQSDRSVPQCSFSKGIQQGRLMGREYRGVLLIMLCILRSSAGRRIMGQSKKKKFSDDIKVDDWILLVETLLQWEAYLCQDELMRSDVKKLERKHRYMMYLMRRVAHRSVGMGLKILKFHILLHFSTDMLLFGVPLEFDTSANESHHKVSKQGAKLTQKAAKTFNLQTANRMTEFRLIELALLEIQDGSVVWDYFAGCVEEEPMEMESTSDEDSMGDDCTSKEEDCTSEEESMEESMDHDSSSASSSSDSKDEENDRVAGIEIHTGDARIEVYQGDDGEAEFKMHSRSKSVEKTRLNHDLVQFLWDLQVLIADVLLGKPLPIFTAHKRGDQMFRAHPNYRGKGPWRDWVWVNWGQEGRLPCHIWCFVVLEGLQSRRNAPDFGGIKLNRDGVYAVVECSQIETCEQEIGRSSILLPIRKTVDLDSAGNVSNRHYFLADTDAFVKPCSVVADIGGPPNRYFVVKSRTMWANDFQRWLRDPHAIDEMDPLDENDQVIRKSSDNTSSEEEN
jgi:hypothetical protein